MSRLIFVLLMFIPFLLIQNSFSQPENNHILQTIGDVWTPDGDNTNIQYATFTPDGQFIVIARTSGNIELYNPNGNLIRTYAGHSSSVLWVDVSPDGALLVSGSSDNTAIVWNVETGNIIHTLIGHENDIVDVSFSPDGNYILTGGANFEVRLWDVNTGNFIWTFLPDSFDMGNTNDGSIAPYTMQVYFTSDGSKFVIASKFISLIQVWNVETLELEFSIQNTLASITCSETSNLLASSHSDSTLKLWNTENGELVQTIQNISDSGTPPTFFLFDFSHDNNYIITSDWDGHIRIWNVETSQLVGTVFHVISNVEFSPLNNNQFISWNLDSLHIWGSLPTPTPTPTPIPEILNLTFSDDSNSVFPVNHNHDIDTVDQAEIALRWDYFSGVQTDAVVYVQPNDGLRQNIGIVDSDQREFVWEIPESYKMDFQSDYTFFLYLIPTSGDPESLGYFQSETLTYQLEVPLHSIYVTDHPQSMVNLIGDTDSDFSTNNQIVIRWNFGDIVVRNVYVYVYVNNSPSRNLLGFVRNGDNHLVWSNSNPLIRNNFRSGPISGNEYRFEVLALSTENELIRLTTDQSVSYSTTGNVNQPTFIPTITETSTPTATPTIFNSPTPKPKVTPTPIPRKQ